jgi:tripartite-type tricarboxylate transporter receptor subunit TctC
MRPLLALLFFSLAQTLSAQDYPAREIRSICNFAAGSGADIIVRYYSEQLARLAGKPVIVENRPGAQGAVASAFVAKSAPDGYTIHITPASSTLAAAPHIFKQLPFDPIRDFASVTTINSLTFVVAVDAAKPLKSIQDLINHLKQRPGHGFYGTQSNSGLIAAELFKANTGLNTVCSLRRRRVHQPALGVITFMSVDSTGRAAVEGAHTGSDRGCGGHHARDPTTRRVPGVDVAPWRRHPRARRA